MATVAAISPLVICNIIDKIGVNDFFFPSEIPDCTLPGPRTPDTLVLEDSLRRLVSRFQSLEQKCMHQNGPNSAVDRPRSKQVQNIKSGEPKHVCMSCGHSLDIPLTPDETPPADMTVPHGTPRNFFYGS